jgi:16S rRNA (cytosine1402-N4)-methyltransferase
MDPDTEISAYDLVNTLPENELADLIYSMDEVRWARRIAHAIVEARRTEPIETTGQLADIVSRAIPRRFHPRRIHPATKTFLALRVAVNHEKESLISALKACRDLLAEGGTLVVICYSSFEDRIVKSVVRETPDKWEILTKKAVTPSEDEVRANPRSRSARLRAYRRSA